MADANLTPSERETTATDGWTLPGHYYYDPAIYARELEQIFYRSWQYVGHQCRLGSPGQYMVRDIGDQSVAVLRDEHGELRAFHNVCQHRAHRLLEGEGNLDDSVVCPYHAWRYGLAGDLRFARGSERVPGFNRNSIRLASVRVETLCGFVFVNLDPDARTLAEMSDGLTAEIESLAPRAPDLVRAHVQTFELAANWKNSVENYAECYHCPSRHPSLVDAAIDIDQYRINVYPGYHRHVTTGKGRQQGYTLADDDRPQAQEFASWFLWPNMVFEVYPGGNLTVFHHVPSGPERTVQETEWYFAGAQPTSAEREVIDFVNVVREEDIPICESVQRGLHSKGYGQGRLVLTPGPSSVSENGVADFQRRVREALASGPEQSTGLN